jgi:hypothetical protein
LISPVAIAAYMAAAKLLLHLLTNGQYGYFRDELYYLACGEHLDWGYPDCAPLIALVAWISRHWIGESLQAIRLLPALAGAGMVFMTGLLARDMGGRGGAVFLACLGVICAPVYLIGGTLLSMNAFEPLFWTGCLWLAWRAAEKGDSRLWIWAGILAGLGLENKHSTAFFLAALAAGLLLSGRWRDIRDPWMWAGLGIAAVLFLPNVVWQYLHNWATLELLQNVKRIHKNVELTPWAFVGQQAFILLPTTALVWGAGFWRCLRRGAGGLRLFGWTYLALLAVMIVLKAKHYYLAPIYPALFAAGGLWWEELTPKRWPRRVLAVAIAATGALFLPMVLPVLPPARLVAYQEALGIAPPKTEVAHEGPLPQHLGDMFGWPEEVAEVSRIWWSLPPADRARAAILAGNYGEAGAVDFFGRRHGLPPSVCAHQGYYFWGPRDATGDVLILLQWDREAAGRWFGRVEVAGQVGHPWAMAEEHFDILVVREPKVPLKTLWPRLKHWN